MVEFGNLTESEKQKFSEEVQKSLTETSDNDTQIWPEDDENLVSEYFEK